METGSYEKKKILYSARESGSSGHHFEDVCKTLSPAMDILISSNFERLLFHLLTRVHQSPSEASKNIAEYMRCLKADGGFSVPDDVLKLARDYFNSSRISNNETSETITRYYHVPWNPESSQDQNEKYVLDPHSAVGVKAAENVLEQEKVQVHTIVMGTASPGKFPEAVLSAINIKPTTELMNKGFSKLAYEDFAPKELVDLEGLPKRCIEVKTGGAFANAVGGVRKVIEGVLGGHQTQGRL